MKQISVKPGGYLEALTGTLVPVGLYLISLHNYLLFHINAALLSIVMAVSFFIIVWNCLKAN